MLGDQEHVCHQEGKTVCLGGVGACRVKASPALPEAVPRPASDFAIHAFLLTTIFKNCNL